MEHFWLTMTSLEFEKTAEFQLAVLNVMETTNIKRKSTNGDYY